MALRCNILISAKNSTHPRPPGGKSDIPAKGQDLRSVVMIKRKTYLSKFMARCCRICYLVHRRFRQTWAIVDRFLSNTTQQRLEELRTLCSTGRKWPLLMSSSLKTRPVDGRGSEHGIKARAHFCHPSAPWTERESLLPAGQLLNAPGLCCLIFWLLP